MTFAGWWLWLWGFVAIGLLVSLFLIPFQWWVIGVVVGFGTMEGIGLFAGDPHFPPLTQVIHRFLPVWLSLPLIWALAAGSGARWFHWAYPLGVAFLAGVLGWLNVHFDETYDI